MVVMYTVVMYTDGRGVNDMTKASHISVHHSYVTLSQYISGIKVLNQTVALWLECPP